MLSVTRTTNAATKFRHSISETSLLQKMMRETCTNKCCDETSAQHFRNQPLAEDAARDSRKQCCDEISAQGLEVQRRWGDGRRDCLSVLSSIFGTRVTSLRQPPRAAGLAPGLDGAGGRRARRAGAATRRSSPFLLPREAAWNADDSMWRKGRMSTDLQ